jgi:gluconokinase
MNNLHRQPHFIRAVLEGMNYALYDVFCELIQHNDPIKTIYASGGFVQSDFWVQMVADIFNKDLVVNDQADASAIGAAMLGRFATGLSKNFSAPPSSSKTGKTFYPDIEKHKRYMQQFAIFRALYLALEKEFPKLADL